MKTVYFILGMHRSGTSALAGVLSIMGLDVGSDLMPQTEMNPKGYFENLLSYRLNEKILYENKSAWDDCHFKLNKISKERINTYKQEIKNIIETEFRYAEKFLIKDPRICILFPIWESACLELDLDIKIVIPHRSPIEIANSLKKRNSFSYEKSLILWLHHFLTAEYLSRKYVRLFTSFDELLNDTKKTVDKLYTFVGLSDEKTKRLSINQFLDKKTKHNNSSIDNFTTETPKFLQRLFKIIKNSDFDNLEVIDSIRKDFYYSLEMFQYREILESITHEKEQSITIGNLTNNIELLEQVKDISLVNKDYYLNKYSDLKKYKGNLFEHYYLYGKSEGRIPNQYCECFNIETKTITSNAEQVFLIQNQLQQSQQELTDKDNTIKELLQQKGEISNKNKQALKKAFTNNQSLEKSLHEKGIIITKLQVNENEVKQTSDKLLDKLKAFKKQKQQYDLALAAEQKTNTQLNTNINKQQKQINQQSKQLEENINTIVKLQKHEKKQKQLFLDKLKETTNLIQKKEQFENNVKFLKKQLKKIENSLESENIKNNELSSTLHDKEKQLNQKDNELKDNNQKIATLQKENNEINSQSKKQIKKIEDMNKQIDEIIEDLVSLKESKCWIYTKPIRNLQKLFKD
jgi:hypothetical protein